MKPFAKWTLESLEEEFQLIQKNELAIMQDWLKAELSITPEEQSTLQKLARKLALHVRDWNEEELKMGFIALLLDRVDFYDSDFRPFMEREMSVEYADNKKLWGVVDFLVAAGRHLPKQPLFFIHEYKKQLDASNDPLAQLLAEMLAAQFLNQHKHPIYGAYVIGRHWYFVVLQDKLYCESLAYDATKDEIFTIFRVLRHTKQLMQQTLKNTWRES